jgi:hypothetical protein
MGGKAKEGKVQWAINHQGEMAVSCKCSGRPTLFVRCDHDFALPSKVPSLPSSYKTAVRSTGDSNCYLICCCTALPAQYRLVS